MPRKLADQESATLRNLAKRKREHQARVTSARANITSHREWVDGECKSMIDAKDTSSDWEARRDHCLRVQIPQDEQKAKTHEDLAAKVGAELDTEKAKWKNPVEARDLSWTVDE